MKPPTVFKRTGAKGPTDPYYTKFCHLRKQYFRSCQTSDKRTALQRARQMRDLIVSGKFAEADQLKAKDGQYHSFADLFEAYDAASISITASARRKNKQSLLRLLGAKEGDSLKALEAVATVEPRYFGRFDGLDERAMASKRRSYNASLQQAKSVFGRRYMPAYKALRMPPLVDFMALMPVRVAREPWVAPEHSVIEKLGVELAKLEQDKDPLAAVIILAGYAGLRSNEIIHCRWAWFGDRGIRVAPDRDFRVKGFASRIIAITQDVRERLLALKQGDDYVIAGSFITDRENLVRRRACQWVRQCGIADRKPLHALRKLFGSLVATGQGLYAAQRALGHSSPSVTNDHYAAMLNPTLPVSSLACVQAASVSAPQPHSQGPSLGAR
jgi:integrase